MGVITFDRESVIQDPAKHLDWVMCCYYFNKAHQTQLFRGKVISLSEIVQKYQDDKDELRIQVEQSLQELLDRHFDKQEVSVSATDNSDGTYNLGLEGQVWTKDGKSIDLGLSLTYRSNKLMTVLDQVTGIVKNF